MAKQKTSDQQSVSGDAKHREETAVIYTGGGAYMQGLPTKNMSAEEWERYDPELRQAALKLGLYQIERADA